MATKAHPQPIQQLETKSPPQKSEALQSEVAATSDQASSFMSLKNQLARVEGSLTTKEASLVLARDLVRAREEELSRQRQILAAYDARFSQLSAKILELEAELEGTRKALESQGSETAKAKAERDAARQILSSWNGLLLALIRKMLFSARYGAFSR
jgi:chromosome segregation ATPase